MSSRMHMLAKLWVLSVVGALSVIGCARTLHTPEQTMASFSSALEEGRYRDAYRWMSEAFRRRVSLQAFRRQLRAHPEQVRDLRRWLVAAQEPATVSASVVYGDSEEEALRLVQEEGRWRIVGNPLNVYDQSSPRTALRSFLRAIDHQRYDVVLRLVPNEDREGMTEEMLRQAFEVTDVLETERMLFALHQAKEDPIEVLGDLATLSYGDGHTVRFVREEGVWKIQDPD